MDEWADKAACKDMGPDIFYPHREDDNFAATKICAQCPVAYECLVFAIENHIEYGIWGGYGIRARRRIKRKGLLKCS